MSQALTTAGGAAGLGLMAAMGPVGWVAAAATITFAVLGAQSSNKRLAKMAKLQMEAIDDEITQVRVKALDELMGLSRRGRGIAGEAQTVFAGRSGLSVSEILSALAADVAEDTAVLQRNRENTVEALQAQKRAIANQASSQMQSPVLAGVSAGIAGVSTGLEIGGTFNQVQAAKEAAKVNRTLHTLSLAGGVLDSISAAVSLRAAGGGYDLGMYRLSQARADLSRFKDN